MMCVMIDEQASMPADDVLQQLFAGGFEAQGLGRDERPVNLEVAGDSVVAKTPDGTRVATPTSFAANAAGVSAARPAAAKPRASYAAAVKSEPTDFHLEFSMGGQDIKLDTTVYGAVHRHASLSTEAQRLSMWSQIYEIRFRKVAGPARVTPTATAATAPSSRPSGAVVTDMPSSIPADSQQAKILQLLSVLHRLNSDFDDDVSSATLAESAFVNNKLTAKLNRQLEEPMIVASACLPSWATDLPAFFPFLFPFETRYTFLQSTAFGYARLMQKWVGQARTDNSRRDDNLGFLGRLQRQKVRISRERMLESAFKVRQLCATQIEKALTPSARSLSCTARPARVSKSSSSPKSEAVSVRHSNFTPSSRKSLLARISISGATATAPIRRSSTMRLACSRRLRSALTVKRVRGV